MAKLFESRWVRDAGRRRICVIILVVVFAILSLWPRHYLARAALAPDDSGGGLSSLLGAAGGGSGLLALGSLFGTHQSIEEDLAIARSDIVLGDVVRRLRLTERRGYGDFEQAEVKLRKKVDMETVRGSIVQISVRDSDRAFAKALAAGFVSALRDRLTALNMQQAVQKKVVAENRLQDASAEVATAQGALDRFRAANKLAAPEIQLGSAVAVAAGLQARLEAEQAELRTAQQFATGNNIQVQVVQARIAGLQNQIAAAQANAGVGGGPTLGQMSPIISQYENLYRNEQYAQAEFEIYKRYLDSVIVDQLSATTNMDVIEPAYVKPERQYNLNAVGALILVLVLGGLAEFYVVRPPPGRH